MLQLLVFQVMGCGEGQGNERFAVAGVVCRSWCGSGGRELWGYCCAPKTTKYIPVRRIEKLITTTSSVSHKAIQQNHRFQVELNSINLSSQQWICLGLQSSGYGVARKSDIPSVRDKGV